MPSSNAFSFYDAATVVQEQEAEKSLGNTEEDASPACSMEEETSLDVDDVRDEADVIVKEDEEGANAAKPTELRTTVISGPGGVNQWLDRANALNEIRVMLKEEIEQDSGEYFVCYIHAHFTLYSFHTNANTIMPIYTANSHVFRVQRRNHCPK